MACRFESCRGHHNKGGMMNVSEKIELERLQTKRRNLMETYWIVYTSDGNTSEKLQSIPDIGTWIEDNVTEKTRHFTVKRQRYDKKKLIEDTHKEMGKLEDRINRLKEKMNQLNSK
jgi:hypothetical protein